MRVSVLALVGGMLAVPLRADLRIAVQETSASRRTTRVEFFKGTLWRYDWDTVGGYWIVDSVSKRTIAVDLAKREYSIQTDTPHGQPIATDPSTTIVIESETRDTGEQRPMFGHRVRHFITTERRRREYRDKPPSEASETVTDGWYMDMPAPLPKHGRFGAVVLLTTARFDQHGQRVFPGIKVTRNGAVPGELPVWEKTGERLLEMTEFSEAPLDQSLFEPPEGFRRVLHAVPAARLSLSDQLLLWWRQFEGWLGSLR